MKLLFVTTFCPKCKTEKIKAADMSDCKIIYADTKEGLELARKYGISSVPTWVEINE